jgi:acyl dehydratase
MAVAKIDASWIGREFDVAEFHISEEETLEFARACGETDPRFTDPGHPDFQASPTFTAKFVSRRVLPDEFRRFGGRGFDAGKTVSIKGPVRPGDRLTARSRIADIYEKTGRSGLMIFIVHRMEFTNQRGEPATVVDWRMVRQPDPE